MTDKYELAEAIAEIIDGISPGALIDWTGYDLFSRRPGAQPQLLVDIAGEIDLVPLAEKILEKLNV